MTSRQHPLPRWPILPLVTAFAFLLAILGGTGSAVHAAAAENRIQASNPEVILLVGASDAVLEGQRLGKDPPQHEFVSATGVAAEGLPDIATTAIGPGTQKAWNVLDRVKATGEKLPGYKGGSTFKNLEGRLPALDDAGNSITYREWDVNLFMKGVNRGTERLVTGSDGAATRPGTTTRRSFGFDDG